LPPLKLALHLQVAILARCHEQLLNVDAWGHHRAKRIMHLLLAGAAVHRGDSVVHVLVLWPLRLVVARQRLKLLL
jgi:hypothetical protein